MAILCRPHSSLTTLYKKTVCVNCVQPTHSLSLAHTRTKTHSQTRAQSTVESFREEASAAGLYRKNLCFVLSFVFCVHVCEAAWFAALCVLLYSFSFIKGLIFMSQIFPAHASRVPSPWLDGYKSFTNRPF